MKRQNRPKSAPPRNAYTALPYGRKEWRVYDWVQTTPILGCYVPVGGEIYSTREEAEARARDLNAARLRNAAKGTE